MPVIEFKEQKQVPELKPVELVIDGTIYGKIEPHMFGRIGEVTWGAAIRLPSKLGCLNHVLILGYGRNHCDAVEEAIAQGLAEHIEAMRLIREFAKLVGVSTDETTAGTR